MLEKRPRVVLLEVLDQALLLLHRQGGAAGDVLDELLDALNAENVTARKFTWLDHDGHANGAFLFIFVILVAL